MTTNDPTITSAAVIFFCGAICVIGVGGFLFYIIMFGLRSLLERVQENVIRNWIVPSIKPYDLLNLNGSSYRYSDPPPYLEVIMFLRISGTSLWYPKRWHKRVFEEYYREYVFSH